MKKTLLLTLALALTVSIFAQTRGTFVDESFDGSSLPTGWTTSELGASNWKLSTTNYSGGEGKELMLSWTPEFNGTTRLITTPCDLRGISDVTVSFKHLFDNFKDNQFYHTIGIATSTDGNTWNIGWSQEYTITDVYEVNEVIATPDMGKENVLFCLFYDGDSHNMDNWFFDDLHIYKQTELDLRVISIDIPNNIISGEKEILFTVENLGVKTIESFEAEVYVSNWDAPIVTTFEKNIANAEKVQFSFNDKSFLAELSNKPYTMYVNILSVNGTTDNDESNNKLEKKISVAYNQAQRIPMIEHFSSSTCGPCVAVNQQMLSLLLNNEGKYTYTKFTTVGDPYYTQEVGSKVSEYGVSGVPNLFFDGANKGSNYLTQSQLDERYNTAAYVDIRGAFNIEGSTIKITADFMSYVKLKNAKVFISVNEVSTEKNIGSNGETEFHHVMMKMLPDAKGNIVNIKAGEHQHFEYTYDMSKTFVEELNDLEVALWIQDPVTQEVYNSIYAYAYTSHCYPIKNLTLTQNEGENTLTWEAPEKGSPKGYKVFINGAVVAENTTELSYSFNSSDEKFTAEIIALYNGGMTSVGVAKLFGVEEDIDDITLNAPKNLTATPKSATSIELSWDASINATSYNIYRNNEMIANVVETTFIDEALANNTQYCYTVTSTTNDIESEKSEEVCATTLEDGIDELNSSLYIHPNPTNDRLYIETEVEIEEIAVYDVYGRRLQSIVNNQQSLSIDVADLKSGIYFIKINTNKGNIVKRIIKN